MADTMKVRIIKRFVDKESVRRKKPTIVDTTKENETVEYPTERAKQLIKSGHAVAVEEKTAKKEK